MESGGRGTSGSDNGGSGLMSFRDHNNSTGSRNGGLSSVVMMMNNMPLLASSHHDHPTPPSPNVVVGMNNALFIPLSNSTNNNNNHHHHHHHHHHNNNNNHNHITHFGSNSSDHHQIFNKNSSGGYFMKMNNNKNTICCNNNEEMMSNNSSSTNSSSSFRAKIMAHPHYPRLLTAYVNCQKVGAPPEVVRRLEEVCGSMSEEGRMSSTSTSTSTRGSCIGEDPALDQFMEAYCEMLTKYEQELTKPFKEAMLFISNIESQLKSLNVASSDSGGSGSPEDEIDPNDENYIDPQAEDKELKIQLLRKYSGYLGSLKQEFLKKRKKGKLPKEARQKLLDWWSRHYKWPYPSEGQKLALGETTGLDQKQINNWFINQRKRHWKPSEEMQFVVMDPAHPNQYYIENVMTTNPFALDYCNQML